MGWYNEGMEEGEKERRIYFGKRFYKQKDGYWANIMPIHAHRWVWINHYGAIPKGMDIHHKDGDKSNNEIENLQMLNRSDHLKEHWKDPELRKERRKQLDAIRPMVHVHLRTKEGRERQRKDAIEGWKNRKKTIIICQNCGKEVETSQSWSKFCSARCEKAWNRKNGFYDVTATCAWCGISFIKDKTSRTKCCSQSCGGKLGAKKRNS